MAGSHRVGKFLIFLGAVDGVGKTYAMLERAVARARAGESVVAVGVDTQARPEMDALQRELRAAAVETALAPLDLDAILAQHPTLVLLDNLAAANPPGARHPRRYLDAQELVALGIDVYATLNVAQLESLNQVAEQITGARAAVTVPDQVLAGAEIELIDLAPEELLQRIREGRVAVPSEETRVARNLYRLDTLIALRDLTQRWYTQRVDRQTHIYAGGDGSENLWLPRERVMVCVSNGGLIARVIRAGRQMATSLRAEWVAVYVETPEHYHLSPGERERVARALRLAEELGAETVILPGQNVARELLRYAQAHGITKIVVGKVYRQRWREVLRAPLADELVRGSGAINVFLVNTAREGPHRMSFAADARNRTLHGYILSVLAILAATATGLLLQPYLDPINIALIYLLAVVLSATTWGLGSSIFSSIIAVFLLDALFVPPYGLLSIEGVHDLLTLGVFLLVAVVISELGARVRAQVEAARQREQQTAALYALSRDLAFARDRTEIVTAAIKQITQVFDADAVVLLPGAEEALQAEGAEPWAETERQAAQWAFEHGEAAGRDTSIFAQAARIYLPLRTAQGTFGVLGLRPREPGRYLTLNQRRLLETFAGQIAVALEHAKLSAQAEQARLLEASDRFRNALLSSISHDLRTPLASILGSVTSLLDRRVQLAAAARDDLLTTIQEEATRLNRLVGNLLNMTRLEAGALTPQRDWHSLEEVVGAALAYVGGNAREVRLALEPDLPLVPFDFVLIEQVLSNLLDNAFKFAPADSPVELTVRREPTCVRVSVADRGIGIPPEEFPHIFEKFYRVRENGNVPGTGLGLSICKGVVEAHGGTIWAEPREGGGTCIRFTLPLRDSA
jgi:two-component system, OmpR family, sensor histidine kinase KdpD